jgi:hypothetical protein
MPLQIHPEDALAADCCQCIAAIRKNRGEVRVALTEFRGEKLVTSDGSQTGPARAIWRLPDEASVCPSNNFRTYATPSWPQKRKRDGSV